MPRFRTGMRLVCSERHNWHTASCDHTGEHNVSLGEWKARLSAWASICNWHPVTDLLLPPMALCTRDHDPPTFLRWRSRRLFARLYVLVLDHRLGCFDGLRSHCRLPPDSAAATTSTARGAGRKKQAGNLINRFCRSKLTAFELSTGWHRFVEDTKY